MQKGRLRRGDRHYARAQPHRLPRGDKHGMTKLSDSQVAEVRSKYTGARGEITKFAAEYNVSRDLIHKIVHNKCRQAVAKVINPQVGYGS